MQDDEISSDELDALLDDAETLEVARPDGVTEVRLRGRVDAETLHELELPAAADDIDAAGRQGSRPPGLA